jgi:leucine-zipper of insertion element IS481
MKQLSAAAVERAMKLQDVMLQAMAKRITWFQEAEILGISCRQMQRWKTRFEHEGYEGLFDRRRGIPAPKRVPLETVEMVLRLLPGAVLRLPSQLSNNGRAKDQITFAKAGRFSKRMLHTCIHG